MSKHELETPAGIDAFIDRAPEILKDMTGEGVNGWKMLEGFDVPNSYVLDRLGIERYFYLAIAIPGVIKPRYVPYCTLSEDYVRDWLNDLTAIEALKMEQIGTVPHIRIVGDKKYPLVFNSNSFQVFFPRGDAYLLYTHFPEASGIR